MVLIQNADAVGSINVMTSFRPLAGIMVLIWWGEGFEPSKANAGFRPLAGIMVLIIKEEGIFMGVVVMGFRPLAGIMVLIFPLEP